MPTGQRPQLLFQNFQGMAVVSKLSVGGVGTAKSGPKSNGEIVRSAQKTISKA